ncbi:MAG: universal stress protein, partial [Armatimonadetes bacterium]|nr:universal stress protein [Armatimonadota bacterium]
LALFALAVGGKALGAYLGARLAGRQPHWPATAFGAGLNARGGTDIIIATVGLTLGLISGPLYSVVVVQAMLASLLSPTALRWALRRVTPSSEELARLEAERQSARSLVGSLARVLVPIRPPSPTVGDAAPTIAATRAMEIGLLSSLSRRRSFQTTLFSVAAPGARAAAERYLGEVSATFSPLKPAAKVVEHRHPPEAVIAESQRNYDLMLLGAHVEPDHPDAVFDPVVDDLIRLATCPTLVVRGKPAGQTMSWPPERILVRANGTRAARHAAEVAFALAGEASEVILLHVVVPRHDSYYLDVADRYVERHLRIGHEIVGALAEIGRGAGVSVDHEVRVGRSEDAVILEVAQTRHVDVLVLGTHLRPASERLYLGARVERLLRDAACAVMVVNAP